MREQVAIHNLPFLNFMAQGSAPVPLLAYYPGNPTGVSTNIFNQSKGTIVLDTTNAVLYQKTSALGDNSGYSLIATSSGTNTFTNSLVMGTASQGLVLKQGANGLCGTFVCNGATPVTVSNTNVAITDAIIVSLNTVGGTVGAVPAVKTITAATGFTIAGTASDTSTYNYAIIKNAA